MPESVYVGPCHVGLVDMASGGVGNRQSGPSEGLGANVYGQVAPTGRMPPDGGHRGRPIRKNRVHPRCRNVQPAVGPRIPEGHHLPRGRCEGAGSGAAPDEKTDQGQTTGRSEETQYIRRLSGGSVESLRGPPVRENRMSHWTRHFTLEALVRG